MKKVVWLLSFIAIGIIVFTLDHYFFSSNSNAEKYVNDYIDNSVEISIYVPRSESEFSMKSVYTGITALFNQGRMKGRTLALVTFFSDEYKKYFYVNLPGYVSGQYLIYDRLMLGQLIKARVNQYDLESSHYGTQENPVPIFMPDLPSTHPDYLKVRMTEEQYKETVLFYLKYIMSKEEFNERFK